MSDEKEQTESLPAPAPAAESAQIVVAKPQTLETARAQSPVSPAMQDLRDRMSLAKVYAASGAFQFKTPETVFAVVELGRELGLAPTQALQAFDLIQGRPRAKADTLVAVCLRRPDICQYFVCTEDTDTASTWETHRVGAPAKRVQRFTLEDAEKAGLLKNPVWKTYGFRMLSMRAKTYLARDVYPDLTLGLRTPDEAQEIAFADPRAMLAAKAAEQDAMRAASGPGDAK